MISISPTPRLSWGLAIATKDRIEELCLCIEKALGQTRPADEIIIVDASEAWQDHAARIREIAGARVRIVYIPAVLPSLPEQRNQAIDAAQADIVFMIDDDSFMFPDCAEKIMAIYEADRAGDVVGAQASLSDAMPGAVDLTASQTESRAGNAMRRQRFRWILRTVFLMGSEQIFIPYHGHYPDRPVPHAVKKLGARPERLFHGARMTFRREVILDVRFESLLRFYAPFEDLDASHRVSHRGALVTVEGARLYHHMTTTNRMKRFRVTWLSMLNHAVLLRRHAGDPSSVRRRYSVLMVRRITAEFLKDLLARRFDFPQCHGALRAWRDARRVFAMDMAALETWYPGHQKRIVEG